MKEWQTFVRKFSDMKEGKRELFIKDLAEGPRKYDTTHVIAKVSRKKTAVKNPDKLWLRSESGIRYPEPWYISIEKELPEYVEGKPWTSVFDALDVAERQHSKSK
ncbi:MAG: hypothetical protein HY742_02755 [Deltaproteobacteria bacterium]|nr:hypothetical protein [Deltaproteobacteria bacterium]